MVLFASRRLSLRICLRSTTSRVRLGGGFVFLDLIAPIVQDPTRYPEVSCQCNKVSTRTHPFDSLLSKSLTVPLTLPLLHFATPFTQSVHDKSALAQRNSKEPPQIHPPETLGSFCPLLSALTPCTIFPCSWTARTRGWRRSVVFVAHTCPLASGG
jgi:hypothetical protein